jgi:hypothetical protein
MRGAGLRTSFDITCDSLRQRRGIDRATALASVPSLRWVAALVVLAVILLGDVRPARSKFDGIALKVAMIGKIAEFVHWPAGAGLEDPARPLEFVMLGASPLEPRLAEYYRQVRIAGHRVFFRRAHDVADVGRPQILFLAPSVEDEVERVVNRLNGTPVLIVADTDGFGGRGVAVNLFLTDDQVGFEISRAALQRNRLEASYHLLTLARLVDAQQARR